MSGDRSKVKTNGAGRDSGRFAYLLSQIARAMAKPFYELDGIIEMNEKRLSEYTVLYQKVFDRLTNIIYL